jgi:hypothetical protein
MLKLLILGAAILLFYQLWLLPRSGAKVSALFPTESNETPLQPYRLPVFAHRELCVLERVGVLRLRRYRSPGQSTRYGRSGLYRLWNGNAHVFCWIACDSSRNCSLHLASQQTAGGDHRIEVQSAGISLG